MGSGREGEGRGREGRGRYGESKGIDVLKPRDLKVVKEEEKGGRSWKQIG